MSPTHKLVISLPHHFYTEFCGNKRELNWLFQGTSAVGVWYHNHHVIKYSCISDFTLHYHSPRLYPYQSNRWKEQTCLTNRQLPWKLAGEILPSRSWILPWAICMISTMGGSPFCSHGGSLTTRYLPWLRTLLTPLSQWIHPQEISTQASAKNHHPSSTVCQHAPATSFPHPEFPSFYKR